MSLIDETNQTFYFWKSRKGIFLQIIIVLVPSFLLLRSGNLLLLGVFISLLLAWLGLRLQHMNWADVGLKRSVNLRNIILITLAATLILFFYHTHFATL